MTVTALDVHGRRWYVNDVVTCSGCPGAHRIADFVPTINPSAHAAAARLVDMGEGFAPCWHVTALSDLTLVRRATPDEWPCSAGAYPFLPSKGEGS